MARIEIPEGPGPDIHRVWLLRPEMAVGAGALADAVYAKSQLPPRVREAARMAVAQRNECQVCLGWRDPSLAEAGVDEALYAAVRDGDLDGLARSPVRARPGMRLSGIFCRFIWMTGLGRIIACRLFPPWTCTLASASFRSR